MLVGSFDSGSYQAYTIGEGLTSCPFYTYQSAGGIDGRFIPSLEVVWMLYFFSEVSTSPFYNKHMTFNMGVVKLSLN